MFGDQYCGKTVLVTGHTGFKGSWLCMWLHHLGAKVWGYSIGLPSEPAGFDLLGLQRRLEHRQGDVRDRGRLAEVMDEARPDVVFHLAAQALVKRSYADPVETFSTNVMGMVNLLECVRERPWIDTVVLITSDKVYRNDEWVWGYRESDHLGGKDPYSASKGAADIIAQSYWQSYGAASETAMAIARAGNVIGGGDWGADRIVPDAIRAWSTGEAVQVRSPEATRPWQHVMEPLSGYLWLGARLQQRAESIAGEAYNFGPDARTDETVGQLLDTMAQRWQGAKWHATPENAPQKEARLLKLCCDKALADLGWAATLQFDETVSMTVDWYRTWHEKGGDLYDLTLAQIDAYCQLAASRRARWAD